MQHLSITNIKTTMIEWRVIPSFPNYEASSDGKIRNIKKQRLLKQSCLSTGYVRVIINNRTQLVHRLVAEAFYVKKGDIVHHINNIKSDNRVENLEWTTQSYNVKKAYLDGLCSSRKGDKNPNYKTGRWVKT